MEQIELIEEFDVRVQSFLTNGLGELGTVRSLVWGLVKAGTVNLKEVVTQFTEGKAESNYRKLQRLFKDKRLDDVEMGRLLINLLFKEEEELTFAIDRTEWSFGETWHNLLIVSVLCQDTAVPIVIKPLEGRGCSDFCARREVIETLLKIVPWYRIKFLVGDREFIGEKWFHFLLETGVSFVMRVRNNQVVREGGDCFKINELPLTSEGIYEGKVQMGTKFLQLSVKDLGEERLALVSFGVKSPLEGYRERWGIETGFKCLKTKGFNLEETHFRDPLRVKMLTQVCAMAMGVLLRFCQRREPDLKKN